MSLLTEIQEQPAVLERQLKGQKANVKQIAEEIKAYNPSFMYIIARGTSEHAGIYGQYLMGIEHQLVTAFAAPSMSTFYGSAPCVKGALAVAISQSGKSPDLIASAQDAKDKGAKLLVITNTVDSPLGEMGDWVIDCMAGPERATAATKSYTTSLLAFSMLSAALHGDDKKWAELEHVPEWVNGMFSYDEKLAAYAEHYVFAPRVVVLGRGYNFCSAKEWGLKMQELTYMMAEPYSSAVFQHGPIAMVENGYPVMNIIANGKVADSALPQLEMMKNKLGADIFSITNNDRAAELSNRVIALPKEIPEWLSPIAAIIPAQIFARYLCFARGLDTETPRTIAKVTETH